MTDNYLQITRNGKILGIVFNKPKVNAICVASSRELGQVFAEFRDDPVVDAGMKMDFGA